MGIFLDTGFFLGLCHPKDEHHQNSVQLLRILSSGQYGLIYTSPYVISEAATLLLVRTQNNQPLLTRFYQLLYGPKPLCRILSLTPDLDRQTWNLFLKFNKDAKKKEDYCSYVDASNIVLCKNYNVDNIVSFNGHFDSLLTRIQ